MTTTPEAGMRLEPFERYPALASWIAKMAASYTGLSLGEWMTFVGALNAAIVAAEAAAPVPPAGGEGEALTFDQRLSLDRVRQWLDRHPLTAIHPDDVRVVYDLAARAQPPVGEVVNLAAMREYAVAMTKKHGNPIGTDYEQGQNDMGYRWVHSFDDLPAAHPPEPAARDGGEALRSALVWARYHVVNSVNSDRLQCLAAIDAALAAGWEK